MSSYRYARALMLSMMLASCAACAQSTRDIELYSGLLSWAEKLSGYPPPQVLPTVEFVPQAFFNKHACNDQPCHVWAGIPTRAAMWCTCTRRRGR